jgi:hypothetical protein
MGALWDIGTREQERGRSPGACLVEGWPFRQCAALSCGLTQTLSKRAFLLWPPSSFLDKDAPYTCAAVQQVNLGGEPLIALRYNKAIRQPLSTDVQECLMDWVIDSCQ